MTTNWWLNHCWILFISKTCIIYIYLTLILCIVEYTNRFAFHLGIMLLFWVLKFRSCENCIYAMAWVDPTAYSESNKLPIWSCPPPPPPPPSPSPSTSPHFWWNKAKQVSTCSVGFTNLLAWTALELTAADRCSTMIMVVLYPRP